MKVDIGVDSNHSSSPYGSQNGSDLLYKEGHVLYDAGSNG